MTPNSEPQISARFAIEQLLGEGGSSIVWQARDASTGQLVALKCLKRAADGSFLLSKERFVAEAALLQGLDHPNIVRVVSLSDENDGTPYFAMGTVVVSFIVI